MNSTNGNACLVNTRVHILQIATASEHKLRFSEAQPQARYRPSGFLAPDFFDAVDSGAVLACFAMSGDDFKRKLAASRQKMASTRQTALPAPQTQQTQPAQQNTLPAPATQPSPIVPRRARTVARAKIVDIQATPPHADEAEQAVLGAMLQWPETCVPEARRLLTREHFYSPANAELFATMLSQADAGKAEPSRWLIPFTQFLRDSRRLDALGGVGYVTTLATVPVAETSVPFYALMLQEKYVLRELIAIGTKLVQASYGAVSDEVGDIIDDFSRWFERIKEDGVNGAIRGQRAPLTIRTIDEILGMSFDAADLILPNGYLTLGDATSICGPGGIGKTRLTMQLAMCCRAGRDFLGWPTNGRDLRFLFLQTENSSRRLQSDLEKMLTVFKPEEQEHIQAGIFFHTLEHDEDGFLALDFENQKRIENAITDTGAHVIVCDPLRDFSLDDLNSDKVMDETVRDLSRVIKRGNPKRVPLIVHHAATGKAGAQKTTGWDRASFGRNSKVLLMKMRAVINVGQAQPDENSVIIIASGKANNAPEFAAFAARLNFDTMRYTRDDDFDMEGWREEVSSSSGKGKHGRATPGTEEDFYDLTPPTGSIEKNLLLQNAGDESRDDKRIGDKRARVYLTNLIDKGRLFEWRIKRPKTNPRIEISRHEQTLI